MQTVSQEWKDNQNQQLVSESFVEISLDMSNPDALTEASVDTTGSTGVLPISNPAHIVDGTDREITTYATLEQNLWLLDGSRKIIPTSNYEDCGYIAYGMSGSLGMFAIAPFVYIIFPSVQENEIPGVTITWSEALSEYPTRFKVTAYNGDVEVASKEVTDNTDVKSLVWLNISGYDRIGISILNWCLPSRRPRIESLLTGISLIYNKNDIFSFSHSQEVDPISATLPKSTISFSLDNTSGVYDVDNSKGIFQYFVGNQEIKVKYGYKIGNRVEWIKGGTFYLSSWEAKENGRTADFTATDILATLNKQYDSVIYYKDGVSLYDLATDLLNYANLPLQSDGSVRWLLDDSLKNVITTACLPQDSIINCLQLVANAGACILYVDRNGVIRIEKRKTDNVDYVISSNNSYNKPEKTLSKPIRQIIINVYEYAVDTEESVFGFHSISWSLPSNVPQDVIIDYSDGATMVEPRLETRLSNATINSVEFYLNSCHINYTRGTDKLSNYIWVYGKLVKISNYKITIPVSDTGEDIVIDNPLISDRTTGEAVGEWIKNYLTNVQNLSFSWRADPRLDAADTIKSNGIYNDNNVVMTKVKYSYNGAFRGTGEGRVT